MKSHNFKCLIITILFCYSLSSILNISQADSDWITCAQKEEEECTFYGHRLLRFGSEGNYIYKVGANKVKCEASYFKPDTIFNDKTTAKHTCSFFKHEILWKQCAKEGNRCEFEGTKFFRYGGGTDDNGDGYIFRTQSDGVLCSNSVFGDPKKRVDKSCYIGEIFDASKFVWKFCGNQDRICNLKGSQEVVRYGFNESWVYFIAKNSIACNDSILGDPIRGPKKICEYQAIDEDSCPDKSFLNGKLCVSKCPDNLLISLDNKTCLSKCEQGQVFFSGTQKCVDECPNGYFIKGQECIICQPGTYTSIDQSSCLSECPPDEFLIKAAKKCYGFCPNQYKVIVNTNECIFDCSESKLLVTADAHYCANPCPDGQFKVGAECFYECPIGHYRNKQECVNTCPEGSFRSADNRECVTECRAGELASKIDQICYSRCPADQYAYGRECVTGCPKDTFKSYDNYECLETCPKDHFSHKETGKCYSNCPVQTYVFENSCVNNCPTGTVLSADKRNCLSSCPKNQFLIASQKSCYYSCPYSLTVKGQACTNGLDNENDPVDMIKMDLEPSFGLPK